MPERDTKLFELLFRPSETASKVPPPERNKRLGISGFFIMQLRQLLQQRLHLLQIARVKAFSEPPANRSEKIAGLVPFVLIAQPRARGARVRYCSDSHRIAALRQLSVWAMYGRRPRCKRNLTYLRSVRVQPCMRPVFRVEACPVAMQPLWLLALM
jgi:hypothetical protein